MQWRWPSPPDRRRRWRRQRSSASVRKLQSRRDAKWENRDQPEMVVRHAAKKLVPFGPSKCALDREGRIGAGHDVRGAQPGKNLNAVIRQRMAHQVADNDRAARQVRPVLKHGETLLLEKIMQKLRVKDESER